MSEDSKSKNGLRRLIDRSKAAFEIPENLNFYSPEDFKTAQRKYVKYCILDGRCW